MATFANVAIFLAVIVFVFVLFPALLADFRWRRARNAATALTVDTSATLSWHQDPFGE